MELLLKISLLLVFSFSTALIEIGNEGRDPSELFWEAQGKPSSIEADGNEIEGPNALLDLMMVKRSDSFWANRGKKDPSTGFWANRGKKDDPSSSFWANRGKKDDPTSTFWANRGKKEDPKSFWANRGKKDQLEDPLRSFWANRGKKDDPTATFWANRGKKDVEDTFIPFWATRGKRTMHKDDEDETTFENDAREKRSTRLGHPRLLRHRSTHTASPSVTDGPVRNKYQDETI